MPLPDDVAMVCLRGEIFTTHRNQVKVLYAIAASTVVGISLVSPTPAKATDKAWFRQLAKEICKRYERGENADAETVGLATGTVSIRNYARAERAVEEMDETQVGIEILQQTGRLCPEFNDDYFRSLIQEQL